MSDKFAMIMINDGDKSVTYHDAEEDAYGDIFATVTQAPSWLANADRGQSEAAQFLLDRMGELVEEGVDDPAKQLYDEHIEKWLEGESAGFYMSVETLHNVPTAEVILRIDGGVVSAAEPIPAGVSVVVYDYDKECYDSDELMEDEDGEEYREIQL